MLGTLGDGTEISRRSPTPVKRLDNAIAIDASLFGACAIRSSGRVVCWGSGPGLDSSYTPRPVRGLDDATAIDAGLFTGCALRASGQVVCWGLNADGEVGDGTTIRRWAATPVHDLTDAIAIGMGDYHACAIRTSGQVVCWGWNKYQQLGDGTRRTRLTPIPPVAGSRGAGPTKPPDAGSIHRCGRLTGQDASQITARKIDCEGAKRVVRRWKKTLPQRNGNGRILGLYCRYRELGHGAASVRCVGAHGRIVRWRTKSIY